MPSTTDPPRPERLLTVQEFAELVRQHPDSIYRRIREGRLRKGVYRLGRDIRVDPDQALQTDHERV